MVIISNPTLVKVDLMLCGVQVSEESALIPHVETNDFSHKFDVWWWWSKKHFRGPTNMNKYKICAKVRKIIQIQDLLGQF